MKDEKVLTQYFEEKSTKLQIITNGATGNWFWTSVEPRFVAKETFAKVLRERSVCKRLVAFEVHQRKKKPK